MAIDGVPFDEGWGTIPNRDGRVLTARDGEVVPREYVVGWAKRGPTGLIGTNSPDSKETVAALLHRALENREDVRLAMLFGSRARGCARPGSDVDLAVEAPGVDLWTLAADLSQAVGLEVDVVDLPRDVGRRSRP